MEAVTIASKNLYNNPYDDLNIRKKPLEKKQEKVKTAVAISYNPNDLAPKILASGKGILAEKIVNKAKEEDIPVHKDEHLAHTLSKLEIGDSIPHELYEVVAEVLLFVDKLDHIKEKVGRSNE